MSGIDYEELAGGVELPKGFWPEDEAGGEKSGKVEEFPEPPRVESRSILNADKVYLPLNHEKYQGIAGAKHYEQTPNRLKRVHYSHEAMIDVILTEPTLTQNELAQRFGRSVSWISIIMGSDAFQAALAKRRDDILDPFLVATIEERFRGLATQSLEVLAEKLELTKSADLALKALDISAKALGMGARHASGAQVQNNFVVQLPMKMEDSGSWALKHNGRMIEG